MKSILLTTILSFVMLTNVFAGWHITTRNTDSKGQHEVNIWIQNGKIKQSTSEMDIVFDSKLQVFSVVLHKIKCYWSGSIADYQKNMPEILEGSLEGALQSIPENERDLYRQQIKNVLVVSKTMDLKVPEVRFEKTSEREKMLGYNALKYAVYANNKLVEYIWLADDLLIENDYDAENFLLIKKELSFTSEIKYNQTFEYFDFIKTTFPLYTNCVDSTNNAAVFSMEVSQIENQIFSDDIFVMPAEYKVIELSSFLQFYISEQIQSLRNK